MGYEYGGQWESVILKVAAHQNPGKYRVILRSFVDCGFRLCIVYNVKTSSKEKRL